MSIIRERDSITSLQRVLDSSHHSAGSIKKACILVDEAIAQNKDNLRGFFEKCFPTLLRRVFGYDDFEASWLNLVTRPGTL
jgi:hypothetical protein